jgi:hypothetical protein
MKMFPVVGRDTPVSCQSLRPMRVPVPRVVQDCASVEDWKTTASTSAAVPLRSQVNYRPAELTPSV